MNSQLSSAVTIRDERDGDQGEIGRINRLAFGGDDEARLVVALRDGACVRTSLVAEIDGKIIGHILFSELQIVSPQDSIPALALAPLAVLPEWQRQGVGSVLVRRGLDACRARGHRIVFVLGHPEFYPQFGFSAEAARKFETVYAGGAFMVAELVPGALAGASGSVRYAPPFDGL